MRTIFFGKCLMGNTSTETPIARNQAVYIIDGRVPARFQLLSLQCQNLSLLHDPYTPYLGYSLGSLILGNIKFIYSQKTWNLFRRNWLYGVIL